MLKPPFPRRRYKTVRAIRPAATTEGPQKKLRDIITKLEAPDEKPRETEDDIDGSTSVNLRGKELMDDYVIFPNITDFDFLVNNSPLYCGTTVLDMHTKIDQFGAKSATYNQSIFAMAHLYNAFKILTLTSKRFSQLDQIMNLNCGPIFANEVPNSPAAMAKSVLYRSQVGKKKAARVTNTIPPSFASQVLAPFFQD